MQSKKLTPLEILHKQKKDLQIRSDELSNAIEDHVKYLQQNFVPLLRYGLVDSVVSKMPPRLRSLTGNFFLKEKKSVARNSSGRKFTQKIALGIAEIAPFFLKGKKGAFFSIILKQISKLIV